MDLLEQRFRWHRRFAAPVPCGGQLLLLSERETLLFESQAVLALAPLLSRGVSLAGHLAADTTGQALGNVPMLMHALSALLSSGHVQPDDVSGAAHEPSPYVTSCFDAAPQERPRPLGDGVWGWDLRTLSPAGTANEALSEARCAEVTPAPRAAMDALGDIAAMNALAARLGAPLTVVLCDDILDPRLDAVHAWHSRHQQPWLLLRLAGEEACIGPVFDPRDHNAACWHCMETRALRQQPGRAWASNQLAADPSSASRLALPVRADPAQWRQRWQALPALLERMLAPNAGQHLLCWRDNVTNAATHTLHKRPQCPHCGDASLQQRIQLAPAQLTARPVLSNVPGGSRSLPPEALTARQELRPSTLLGPVLELARLGADGVGALHASLDARSHTAGQARLHVYRSAFMRAGAGASALPTHGFIQTCLGKGRTDAQAQASALGEAIERLAAGWQGDEAVVLASAHELGRAAIAPTALPRVRGHGAALDMRFDPHQPMRWAPAWSLTHDARRYLPLGFSFRDTPEGDRRHIDWTSNGCAAGVHLEDAILQGLLELIERDAAAIWWYRRVCRPAWPSRGAHGPMLAALHAQLNAQLKETTQGGQAWQTWLLDLTHDLGIPVAAAVAHQANPAGQDRWALGFGCHLTRTVAAERALTEIAQLAAVGKWLHLDQGAETAFMRPAVLSAGMAPSTRRPSEHEPGCTDPLDQAQAATMPSPSEDIAAQIRFIVDRLAAQGMEAIVLDHSRSDLPLRTVKVAVPGLCHIWPEPVPPARLRDLPLRLGWLTEAEAVAQWNTRALLV